jgi:hypothetical protein
MMNVFPIAAVDLATIGYWTWIVVKVAIGLGAVIFVHELGHFLVAKACGVKCDKFSAISFSSALISAVTSSATSGAKRNTASASCRWADM